MPENNVPGDFYPLPPPPHYCHELYMRMADKEVVTIIDEVNGRQVVVFDKIDFQP